MTTSTIPAPPPEDDDGVLFPMTLDDAMKTIEVLREQVAELSRENEGLRARVTELTAERRP